MFQRKSGTDEGFKRYTISSLALAVGDVLDFSRSAGTVVKATASSTVESLAGVVVEATTTADTSVLVQKINANDEFVADTTNDSNASHNYQRMVLTDEATVNNTGTDSTNDAGIIIQLGVVGATTDKKIRCRFALVQDRA